MSKGIRILDGISEWIRKSVGTEAENRGEDDASDRDEADGTDTEEDSDTSNDVPDTPACSSASSNTDLTVLES